MVLRGDRTGAGTVHLGGHPSGPGARRSWGCCAETGPLRPHRHLAWGPRDGAYLVLHVTKQPGPLVPSPRSYSDPVGGARYFTNPPPRTSLVTGFMLARGCACVAAMRVLQISSLPQGRLVPHTGRVHGAWCVCVWGVLSLSPPPPRAGCWAISPQSQAVERRLRSPRWSGRVKEVQPLPPPGHTSPPLSPAPPGFVIFSFL